MPIMSLSNNEKFYGDEIQSFVLHEKKIFTQFFPHLFLNNIH